VFEDRVGRFQRGLGDHAQQVVDAQVAINGLVVAAHALAGHAPAGGMRIEDDRVARGDHAHGVAGQRGERGVTGWTAPITPNARARSPPGMIAAEDLAAEKFHAERTLAERLELLDLVHSRPILVSSISIVPSSTDCSMASAAGCGR